MSGHPSRLPRGRHNLTREEVAESQTARILTATIDVVGTEGFAGATVSKILGLASVSRETFYANFENKQAAFNAAYDAEAEELRETIIAAQLSLPADAEPVIRIDSAIASYLDRLHGQAALSRAVLVEIYAAGPESVAMAVGARQRFVQLAMAVMGQSTPEFQFACEAYIAAVSGTVTQLAVSGRADEIGSLRQPLSALARTILLGREHWHEAPG